MIILSMGYKKLCIRLSFLYIYRIYIFFLLLLMEDVRIELLYWEGLMEMNVEQCYLVLLLVRILVF